MGYLFNLHKSNVCRQIRFMESILSKRIHIKKDRTLTYKKISEIIANVTEILTEIPTKS